MSRTSRLGKFIANADGAVAVWVGIGLMALIPIAALVFDLARVEVTYTELKQAADAAALAGATQLRGETDSIDKATKAAQGAVGGSGVGLTDNSQTWAEGGPGSVKIEHIRFFSELNPDTVTTVGTQAQFIEVSVTSTRVKNWFISVAEGATGLGESNPTAFAVAGYGKSLCQVTPLMVCNPSEETTGTFNPQPGQQVWVKMQSANPINPGFWGPGDFGLLDLPSGQQGANAIQNAFAKKNPFTGCYGNEVSTAPGQKGSVSDGVNTRLDIYVQSAKSYANDKDAYPAYNATKGLVWTNGCSKVPSQGTLDTYTGPGDSNQAKAGLVQYPRDGCLYNGTCTPFNRFGDGNWNRALYWATNHPGLTPPSGWNTWTRYATYRWEVDNDQPPGTKTVPNNSLKSPPAENGNPQCYKAAASLPGGKIPKGADARTLGPINWSSNPDRRVLMTAVVNCKAEGIKGNASNVQVQKWMLMFLTEAMGYYVGGDDNDLFMEVIREIDVDQDKSIAHEIVQLYR